jgi:glutathione peroxidase
MKQGKVWFWVAGFLAAFALMGMTSTDMLSPKNNDNNLENNMKTFHDFTVSTLDGASFDLSSLKGKKVLVVKTASECGLTPQYEQLQELYEAHGGDKFEIIGFPSNDFGAQEPGSAEQIASFCQKNYGVTFPMMAKVHVKDEGQCELYQWLTQKSLNGVGDFEVKWNFHKFLIDENGALVKDVQPQTLPVDEEILNWISK